MQLANARRMPHFSQSFGLNLADPFARHPKLFADLFESSGIAIAQAEAQFEHLPFAFAQAGEHIAELVFEQAEAGDFRGAFR